MAIQVNISNVTGQSPYDVYVCQSDGSNCFYITTISSIPYTFNIPAPYNTSTSYMLKLIDSNGCVISAVQPVTTCSNVTPTITPTNTITPTVTPTNTSTPTMTPTVTTTNTSTPTVTPTTTVTPTVTQTPGLSPSPTNTVSPTTTPTSTSTPTPSVTNTPTNTQTPTVTSTPTNTETPTPTVTNTPTNTQTPTVTNTPTNSETPTNTPTNTQTLSPTNTETPTNTPTPTSTPAVPVTYVGYLADEYTCQYDPGGLATGCTLTSSSIDVRFPTSISPSINRYYAPNPGGCSGSVYYIIGNSLNNTGPIIAGTTAHLTCDVACQEECPF